MRFASACEEIALVAAISAGMLGHFIELDVAGAKMPSYVSAPQTQPRAGVVVIEEIFGVNEDMQRIADLLAAQGYLAVAPNFFHRTDPNFEATHDEAGFAKGLAAAGAVTLEQIVADITAVADFMRTKLAADGKIGTWGFCFGGSVAYLSATLPFVSAAVSFYGGQIARTAVPTRPPLVVVTPQIQAPLLLAFGGQDAHISADDREVVRAALVEHGKEFDFRVYPDEDHGFFRQGPEGTAGARDVWEIVRAFLKANLG